MRYGVVGSNGRMGQELLKVFAAHECVYAADVDGVRETGAPQVVLDFSTPKALPVTIGACERFRAACVVGTTALGDGDLAALRDLATRVPVVQSFNFSQGVTILKMMLRSFAPLLAGWDAEIVETHHNKKKDAPSGTAILLGKAVGRDCPTHSLRLGGVPGDHSVVFANDGEVLELSHRAISRSVFALGALRAAEFALRAKPGYYTFEEVIECRNA
jgi:4-hydroxy-tetrahydrodipicolinate reductase